MKLKSQTQLPESHRTRMLLYLHIQWFVFSVSVIQATSVHFDLYRFLVSYLGIPIEKGIGTVFEALTFPIRTTFSVT